MDLTEQAVARTHITAVLHHYASLARETVEWDEVKKLFEADAVFQLLDGRVFPASRMEELLRHPEGTYLRHHITTINIQFAGADEAYSESYFFVANNFRFTDHWGRWKDVFRRQADGSWLIHQRSVVVEGQAPETWTSSAYGTNVLTNAALGPVR